jgi:DNA-binding XRE family transcriptional regulator
MRDINFQKIVTEIAQHTGMTDDEIAKKCGVQRATISAIRRGVTKTPSYTLGVKLVTLCDATKL